MFLLLVRTTITSAMIARTGPTIVLLMLLVMVLLSTTHAAPALETVAIPKLETCMIKDHIAKLIGQAEQMQDKMKKVQEELSNTTVRCELRAGLVTVELSCKYEVGNVGITAIRQCMWTEDVNYVDRCLTTVVQRS